MALLCPKCMNPMRQYERNRVVVDQCTECGGLFLDRGELEALAAAEQAYYGDGRPPAPVAPPAAPIYDDRRYDSRPPDTRRYDTRAYDSRGYDPRGDPRSGYQEGYYSKGKKRKARSFLEELFDD